MEFEMQSLLRDLDTTKNKVVSLEREVDLGELERFKLDEKLQRSQRKCEEMEETVTRLLEEKQKCDDREKRAEKRCEKISDENSKMAYEFHNYISELNEAIKQVKTQNLENERLARVFQERYQQFDAMVVKMGQEVEDMRHEKLASMETIEKLRRENIEDKKTIEKLRLKSSESEKVADVYKSRLENLSPRMKKIEENLADMLTMNVGDLGNLANNLRELASNSKDFPGSKGKDDDTSGNAAKNGVIMSSPKSKKGDRNSDQPWARGEDVDSHNTVKTSCASQLGRSAPKPESNGCNTPLGSGAHASGTRFMSGEGCFRKTTHSSSVPRGIIEIIDSDDEANHDGAVDVSNVGENEMRFVQNPSSSQRSKRSRKEDLFANSTTEKKRKIHTSDEEMCLRFS